MGVVFVTFDEIGYVCIEEIIKKNIEIDAIISLEDKLIKKKSGYKLFDDLAVENNIDLYKVKNINNEKVISKLQKINPEVLFVIGWSQLINKKVISIPKYGCIGAHPTLLPKHRGRAPIPWAIIHGLTKTGVTMFYIDQGADSGDIIAQDEIYITEKDDALSLYNKILESHKKLIRNNIHDIINNSTNPIEQDEKRASYWPKRTPKDGIIDWNKKSNHLYDWIRALTRPYPGAFTFFNEEKIIIWKSKKINRNYKDDLLNTTEPGEIVEFDEEGIIVRTGNYLIKLVEIEYNKEVLKRKNQFKKIFNIGDKLG